MLKCSECKGYGHTKVDCVGVIKRKEASYATWSESDSDDDNGEELLNFMAYLGVTGEDLEADSESEQEDDVELSLYDESKIMSNSYQDQ